MMERNNNNTNSFTTTTTTLRVVGTNETRDDFSVSRFFDDRGEEEEEEERRRRRRGLITTHDDDDDDDDGELITIRKASSSETEAELLRKKTASMGGEMLRDPKDFVSTNWQRIQCGVHFGICALLMTRGMYLDAVTMDGEVGTTAARAFATVFASYVFSDLGTGIFHWSVDNYGDKNTPIAGNVIDAFQGHHRWPWTITKRQWANNIHKTCVAPLFFTVPQLLAFGGSNMQGSGDSDLFLGSFWALVVLSQQTHAWAHMKPSDQPKIVTKLQDMSLILSRKDHGAHHRSPFEGHYCIINGWWNPLLDGSHFFRKLERVIYETTGVAPRCWTEDDFEVEEDAPDGFGQGVL